MQVPGSMPSTNQAVAAAQSMLGSMYMIIGVRVGSYTRSFLHVLVCTLQQPLSSVSSPVSRQGIAARKPPRPEHVQSGAASRVACHLLQSPAQARAEDAQVGSDGNEGRAGVDHAATGAAVARDGAGGDARG